MRGEFLVALGLLVAIAALLPGANQRLLTRSAALCHLLAVGWLVSRFLVDDFTYRQVWLQSDPNLDWWLKLAGLWSGDEGTLLLLALLSAILAARLSKSGYGATVGAVVLSVAFAAGALYWSPFQATLATDLADAPYRGMNAHLTSVWMLVHPPLIFASYLLLVAPVGSMCAALAVGDTAWREIAGRYGRLGWLLISAGIGFGMWWAYEDFTYGTLWHWDPVQTAVFAAWCFLTAMLHLQSRYRPDGPFACLHPILGLLAATSAMVAMAVTRSEQLASSHRYVGETSLLLFAGIAVAILLSGAAAFIWRLCQGGRSPDGRANAPAVLWTAALLFCALGIAAQVHLALAFAGAHLGLPRPDDLKPFFETLRNFASAGELSLLREAFSQWDVDNFALNGWLVPALGIACIFGSHLILPLDRRQRWLFSGVALIATAAVVSWLQPFEHWFDGRGLTSGKTVAQFPALDALLVALAYLLLSIGTVIYSRARRQTGAMSIPVGVAHIGAILALFGGLSATIFDSYTQRLISIPDDLGTTQEFAGGYTVTIGTVRGAAAQDGARGAADHGAFHTIGDVSWSLKQDGALIDGGSGHTVYRDERGAAKQGTGAIRLMCEAIDYRFARYRSGDSQMIHPLISRGLLRDVQIWLPAALPDSSTEKSSSRAPIVLKTFPLMSLVWTGLLMCFAGAAWHTVLKIRQEHRQTSAS